MSDSKKHQFYICGMHCKACVVLTEKKLGGHPKILEVKSDLSNSSVEIHGYFEGLTNEQIVQELNPLLLGHGYEVVLEKPAKKVKWGEFLYATPIALAFLAVFILLQRAGIVNLVDTSEVGYGTAFMVGVIASLSTCMALVGGLVLSMSATFAKEGDKVKPQLMFHLSRIISFFILGGVIAAIGSTFKLGIMGTFVLGLIVSLVMLLLGINLLDIFNFTKKLQPSMPKFISIRAMNLTNVNHILTPILLGIATFFLPCGFTQAMQLYALSTGDFATGAFTMLSFALGTLPVLALVSFSSFGIQDSAKSGIFFKTAGLVVIVFALFNMLNSFVTIGWLSPIFNF